MDMKALYRAQVETFLNSFIWDNFYCDLDFFYCVSKNWAWEYRGLYIQTRYSDLEETVEELLHELLMVAETKL